MAITGCTTNDSATKKLWEEKLFRFMGFDMVTKKYMGEGDNAIIRVDRRLEKEKGDQVRFHVLKELAGDFILGSSGTSLENNEQKLEWGYQDVTLEEYKIAVRNKGGLDKKRAVFDIDKEAAERLRLKVAKSLDKLWFNTMYSTAFDKILYGGDATATTDLEVADKLTPALLSKAKYGALSGWQSANQAVAREPLRPVMINGEEHLVAIFHPYAVFDFTQDSAYQQMVREAYERSGKNPLFSGAVAVIDNVIVHQSNLVKFSTTGGSGGNVPYCEGILLGAGSSVWCWGKPLEVVDKTFGYDEERGWGAKLIAGIRRTRFSVSPSSSSTTDYGCAGITVACTNLGA